ncbi:Rgg/GadR/MutR family transcriptional regulator [Lactobacillus sp. ESL0677]|uniref:helix-turn-helix domain-containing protein n=1 Tax=Lactobacillus sp. ESL0677 TaxID=2983208 RepID=UPI0023FA10FC|nr:Rgg/GadR/MutR family transcriptional regulator [Lactobacillus sp. ESL0677]WEV36445.1 helix-turn-helix domain-containing protein [Lactobacillus sp. ESL0677]
MKTFGETLQKIRKSRNITQQQLASNTQINRSTISKIEHSAEEPAYELAVKLINNLGITQEEFSYIRNNYQLDTHDKIIYDFLNIAYSSETDKIDKIIEQIGQRNISISDPIMNILVTILQGLKAINANELNLAKELILPIWNDYLAKIETWTILDLYVINLIFIIFDEETMASISEQAIQTIENNYPFLKSLEVNFLLNQAILYMERQDFSTAITSLNRALPLIEHSFRYDKLFLAKGRLAICHHNQKEALHCLSVLKEMEATSVYQALSEEITKFNNQF